MKYIAYYRTRPSEPEASAKALRAQQEAVHKMLAENNVTLSAEYTEREGEEPGYPAYEAAILAAIALREQEDVIDVSIILASHGGIGTGEPFLAPSVDEERFIFFFWLSAILDPDLDEIDLPAGAPQALLLYADFHWNQPDTLLYVCNGTSDELTSVEAEIDYEDWHQLYYLPATECWKDAARLPKKSWSALPPGKCVLVAQRSHMAWDFAYRIRLKFIDSEGKSRAAEAIDLDLNNIEGDPSQSWVPFILESPD